VVIVSHENRIVSTFCDRALLLEGGRIAFEGSGADVVAAYGRRLSGG
jgi:ABC-type polysaccharide/polyol phosphate transport system ATPase subunit